MGDYEEGPDLLTCLVPELKIKIFQALPSLESAIALRSTCSNLNALYLAHETSIRAALRDRIVRAIGAFYAFLTTLHIPRSALKRPPPGGWPHISPQSCRAELGNKTGLVVDVLRHLPYIEEEEEEVAARGGAARNIELRCSVRDYSARTPAEIRAVDDRASAAASRPLSRHMVLVAENGGGGGGGLDMILDTMRAELREEQAPFRGGDVMDVEAYFGMMAERCRNLSIMFVPGHDPLTEITWGPEDGDPDECPDDLGDLMAQEPGYPTRRDARWIRYLYRKAGWPGPGFQKDRALRAVTQFARARMCL